MASRSQTYPAYRQPRAYEGPLDLRAPEDQNVGANGDEMPVWSPAIRQAMSEFQRATARRDLGEMKRAATNVVDATAAYYKMSGVPLFAHDPVPPQLLAEMLPPERLSEGATAARAAANFVELFDDSVKPMLKMQVGKLLKAVNATDRGDPAWAKSAEPRANATVSRDETSSLLGGWPSIFSAANAQPAAQNPRQRPQPKAPRHNQPGGTGPLQRQPVQPVAHPQPALQPQPTIPNNVGYPAPSADEIGYLRRNPHLRREFEWLYGSIDNLGILTSDELASLPDIGPWDPNTMPRDSTTKPTRGVYQPIPRGGAFIDDDGNRLDNNGRGEGGVYRLPEPAEDKTHPVEGFVPTRDSVGTYSNGQYDPFGLYRRNNDLTPRPHYATDIAAPVGSPVRAAGAGIVFVHRDPTDAVGMGNVVGIRHPDGTVSLYAHLDSIGVAAGTVVMPGDEVGTVGLTGNASKTPKNPHLHWEVVAEGGIRPNGSLNLSLGRKTIDPLEWLKKPMWHHGELLPQ
jgi:murein DD-endopeptidase MepM/ murein hydrolase activator NlpD